MLKFSKYEDVSLSLGTKCPQDQINDGKRKISARQKSIVWETRGKFGFVYAINRLKNALFAETKSVSFLAVPRDN